eukprot:4874300-Prorocentrum_lima.AAC.1
MPPMSGCPIANQEPVAILSLTVEEPMGKGAFASLSVPRPVLVSILAARTRITYNSAGSPYRR